METHLEDGLPVQSPSPSGLGQKAGIPSACGPLKRVSKHRRADALRGVLDLQEIARGPSVQPIGNWLFDVVKGTWPRWVGYKFFRKTSDKRSFIIASFHHPARLCWSWSFSIRLKPSRGAKHIFNVSGRFGQYWLRIPFVCEFNLTRQSYDWMLSGDAKRRLNAMASPPGSFPLERYMGE